MDTVYIYTEGNKFIDRGEIKVSKIKNKIKITIRSQPLVILTLVREMIGGSGPRSF